MRIENVDFPDGIGLKCKQCGACCRYIAGDADEEEKKKIQAKGFKDFFESPDPSGLSSFRTKPDGSCWFLTAENLCQVHDAKPKICRIEPFLVTDWDYEKNLIYVDVRSDFQCLGIIPSNEPPSLVIIKAAQEFVREKLEWTAKSMHLPVTSQLVLNRTRYHIMHGTTQVGPF